MSKTKNHKVVKTSAHYFCVLMDERDIAELEWPNFDRFGYAISDYPETISGQRVGQHVMWKGDNGPREGTILDISENRDHVMVTPQKVTELDMQNVSELFDRDGDLFIGHTSCFCTI